MRANPPLVLIVIGILLCVLTYGVPYQLGVACLLIGVLWLIFGWGPIRTITSRRND